jgi:hypothetical protein
MLDSIIGLTGLVSVFVPFFVVIAVAKVEN